MQVSLSSNFPALSPNDSSAPAPDGEHLSTLIEEAIAAYSPVPPQASADSASMRQNLMQLLCWAHSLEQVAGRAVERVQILGTGMRSVVVRVNFEDSGPAEAADALPSSLILKRYRRKDSTVNAGGFGYLRERYGLEALNRQVPGLFPQLYGADPELRVLALEDVSAGTVEGEQYSVAHALLEGTEEQALDALNYYIEAYRSLAASGIMGEAVEDYRLNLARADRKAQFPGAIASPGLAERGLKKLYGVADEARAPEQGADSSPVSASAEHEDAPVLPAAVEELSFRFRRVLQPFFTKRPPVPEQFKLNRGRVYMLSSGDFSPQNVLIGSADGAQVRMVDAEGTCLHHRGFPFVEAMLGFPSSPEYPRYRVDRKKALPALYSALFEDAPLDEHLAEDLAVCTAVTVCALLELYFSSARSDLLPRIRREGAQLMRLLLEIAGSQDATLAEFANRLGAVE
ncbi:hemin ABC transporter substrate-binding protein [Rothia sp. HMSC065C03]|uniref:hemin ABC transporter substrate-binding protein n=1 Tax=Rothia sp. HMSC065C03 TaxID=1715084 RepID=UPI0008A883E2|nr:hemin ABC transporter substrate-binding protein [Rothia sp. HMSC065C03]OHQ21164.1 hemin ABC transporter substrate-binding protein [Rothia sp. HMSC065C03]